MSVYAAVLAAGSGIRFGADKTMMLVRGKPLWQWSFESLVQHPMIDGVGIVCSESNLDIIRNQAEQAVFVVEGGKHRMASSEIGVNSMPDDCTVALVHDAARPFVDPATVDRVIGAAKTIGAAAPAIRVADTVRALEPDGRATTLNRDLLRFMQTPQAAQRELLLKAFSSVDSAHVTDELALMEAAGISTTIVDGHDDMFKVTTPSDLARFASLLGQPETRTGFGFDIHRFSDDTARQLFLGGIAFPDRPGLDGHSDADVILHAVVDALLGAAGLGDIGVHFPNTDPRWEGEKSLTFLQYAAELLRGKGWSVRNIDVTVIAELPKVMPRAQEMIAAISRAIQIDPSRVNVKATTNEKLGSIGRGEGIASQAVATIFQFP